MRTFVVIWLVALLAACQHQGIQETGYEHVYIHPEQAEPVQFKQLFKNYRIVPLETNDSMLVNAIYNVLVYEDRIFLLDRQNQSVLIFSDKGEARALIHNQGNGPQEYVSLFSFALNPFDRSLHLFDDQARKEHVYDWEGHWLSVRPAPYKVTDVLYLDHDRNVKSRLITDIAGGYIMNCYQQDTVVTAQYHPFEYENGATVNFAHNGLFCYIIEPYKYHELSDGDKQEIRSVDPELSKILDNTSTDANPVLLIGTLS